MEPQLYWNFVSSTTFTWFSLDFSGNPKLQPPAVLRKTSPFRTCQKLERLQRQFEHGAGGAEPDAPYTQRSSIRLWMVIQWMEELLQLRGSLTHYL